MNYKEMFEKIAEEPANVTIIFFNGFRKIVLIPEDLRKRFGSYALRLLDEWISYDSTGYNYHIDKELEIPYNMKIRYSNISAYLVFKSSYLLNNEITTEKEFDKALKMISDEVGIVCFRLVKDDV